MARRYEPAYRFVLTDRATGRFPRMYEGLICPKLLTDRLDETYIFDDRDSQELKQGFYNALYKGVAQFDVFTF